MPVHRLVARFARTDPSRVAVRAAEGAIGHGALDAWAGRIAARLAALGVGRESRVGVLCPPSAAMVAAVLGVLRCGAAYVPLDQAQSGLRLAEVLADAGADAALVTAETAGRLAQAGAPLVLADAERHEERHEERAEGRKGAAEAARPGPPPAVAVSPGDAAYLVYTSGSTGEPKGVLVEHGQLAASTLARRCVYPGAPVFLLVSPLAFDSSAAGLWGTLTAGGTLVVATADEVRDPGRLLGLVERHGVTRLLCVPSLYAVLLDAAERLGVRSLRSLESVIVAGEPLPEALVARHFSLLPERVALVNEYGPTEATVWASYHRFEGPGPVSIGGPVPGARLYVLDDAMRPVPRGEEGELFIGGSGVARGYAGRPEATSLAFLADPFAERPGARMYRTGDRVRWNGEGRLEYLGRRDHQVKIRGHRVELEAVEAALRSVAGVREAAVAPDRARTRLVGFVTAAPGTDPRAVREALSRRLPAVMVPAWITVLDRLPVTFSGKTDRAALPALAEQSLPEAVTAPAGSGAPAAGAGPGRQLAERVAAAWEEVLTLPHVPADVNFLDLGGHSLAMFKLQDALERHTGVRPSLVSLFRHTTVAAQAALIGGQAGPPARPLPPGGRQSAGRVHAMRARRRDAEGEAGHD
ncbi:non-ribosomal peptide synthetase [Streptomyces hoynatensis]|uniref:non-ribosomal peptide synthetase n=1 Tax=Streptomyces hoynatensis TaxID=1141874 RepID=UPI001F4D6D00|nr:non-ribosomal peptide synthetase [Streptomyces hoynatensis]